jgi:ATP-dependent DNA helicase RecQ
VNRARAKAMPGGDWAALDPVAQGRVTLLEAGGDAAQAVAALDELLRLSRLDPEWSWRRCAVIARDWRRLEPVRAYAEALGIPIDMANETCRVCGDCARCRLHPRPACWIGPGC